MLTLKALLKVAVFLVLVLAAFIYGRLSGPQLPLVPKGTVHAGLSIDRVAELTELLVVQLDVSDVLIASLQGRTGGVQAVLLVKGDVCLAIDLAAAQLRDVDNDKRSAVLYLPLPTVCRPRLDHARTKLVVMRKDGLWRLSISSSAYEALADRAMKEAQELVRLAGNNADADRHARSHAEHILQTFFRSIDWRVQVRWWDTEK